MHSNHGLRVLLTAVRRYTILNNIVQLNFESVLPQYETQARMRHKLQDIKVQKIPTNYEHGRGWR
jgi:hypothetical protein